MHNPLDISFRVKFPSGWSATPKSKLELIIEQSPPKEKPFLANTEDYPEYKHLISLDIEDAAKQVLDLASKRYMMFCRTLSLENNTKLVKILEEYMETLPRSKKDKENLKNKLTKFLGKEKIAAFQHIKDAYSSVHLAIANHQELGMNTAIKILCCGIYVLYLGDQRFFNENTKTRSEVAAEGGLARKEHYLPTKQKSCALLKTLAPQEGWTQELDAYNAILPEIKKYLAENNIRRPTLTSIEKTLRRWIKSDPIVSAAVRIAQSPVDNSSD
ncbi:hypothetical protein [Pseudomonas sp. MF7451]|uniref:hypothetical protein n=1 Tax=Pseudomonas sp. MF7451 TaxID=2797538 RepID=UPI0018E878F7|nr:hypothetical protein [Pseudomonas sp. MF7451]MBJ2223814.1 hypothetical protein [Pseudomonas sp. MF7451]